MSEILQKKDYSEYWEFLKKNENCHLLQSPVWAKVKSNWQSEIIVSRDDCGIIRAGILVLRRNLPGLPFSMLYAPRGPVCEEKDYHRMKDLVVGIQLLAKATNAYLFKSDPAIPSNDLSFREHALSAGFQMNDTGKNFDGIQPKYVMRLKLKDLTADQIFAAFHAKTRYNIRLAQKKGVTIRVGSEQDLPAFYRLMEVTGKRDGFQIRSYQYFVRMFEAMFPGYLRLYLAEWNNEVIAASLAGILGNKVWYLYGASDNQHRNVMPNYLLQWEMILWAINENCEIYDFRGISGDIDPNNPLYGLYRFKKGFSGETIEFIGELELVFKPWINRSVSLLLQLRKRGMKHWRTK